ncbi:UNKNOWN [Stylonychia lemnae]|uniref:Papain family cysteine protease n=1 Tax=Stylonychia lemnae TaxID=5949 RepID=A0A078ARB6_STYLE|nr:UNKNOWN [Stylonychia lemnae]|eukprot:CDW84526.1 UNKNOWN [Stylonychia lemnae]
MQKNRKTFAIVGSTFVVAALCGFLMINQEGNILQSSNFLIDPNTDDLYLFNQFATEYSKSFKTLPEFKEALTNFKAQNDAIKKYNANSKDTKLGLNQFSDWPAARYAEISRIKQFKKEDQNNQTSNITRSSDLGKIADDLSKQDKTSNNSRKLQAIPANFDHRQRNIITSVKNQLNCGSSYAFAAMAQVESYYLMTNPTKHKNVDLSEQFLVDCSYGFMGKNFGCSGGTVAHTYIFMTRYFYPKESVYPYSGKLQACNSAAQSKNPYGYVSNAIIMTTTSSAALMQVVYQMPVVALVASSSSVFRNYKTGIITSSQCTGNLDLAVLIVGWGTSGTVKYWIIKNQWGTTWGENGYAKIQMTDQRGTCGINQELYVSYAV